MKHLTLPSRRQMLSSVGCGFGILGLRSVCEAAAIADNPFAPKQPHFAPKVKRVIFLFMNGGMSQVDTFDPKPMLARYHGQPMPGGTPKTERKTGETQECFGCHTTAYLPGQQVPARHEMGIRCERCHGPGAEHARVMAAANAPALGRQILHPGKLDAPSQVQMCGVCHGRPPADSDVAALRRIEQSPNTVRFPSQRLVLSRCYNESPDGLACSRCHDPHSNVSLHAADHDRACVACHAKPRRVCPKAAADCASCHMPRQQVMLHSLFTDHFIRNPQKSQEKR